MKAVSSMTDWMALIDLGLEGQILGFEINEGYVHDDVLTPYVNNSLCTDSCHVPGGNEHSIGLRSILMSDLDPFSSISAGLG